MLHRTPLLRRRYAFWLPATFVLIVGTLLSLRNYQHHQRRAVEFVGVVVSEDDSELLATVEASTPAASESGADPHLKKLLFSLTIVALNSVIAGLSIAHLLSRPAMGFHSVEEAQKALPLPILGVVPLTQSQSAA